MSSSSLSSIDQDGEVQSSMAAPADGSFEAADISAAQAVPPAADLSVSDAEVGSCFLLNTLSSWFITYLFCIIFQ